MECPNIECHDMTVASHNRLFGKDGSKDIIGELFMLLSKKVSKNCIRVCVYSTLFIFVGLFKVGIDVWADVQGLEEDRRAATKREERVIRLEEQAKVSQANQEKLLSKMDAILGILSKDARRSDTSRAAP